MSGKIAGKIRAAAARAEARVDAAQPAITIRRDKAGAIDEIVGTGLEVHIEMMDSRTCCIIIDAGPEQCIFDILATWPLRITERES